MTAQSSSPSESPRERLSLDRDWLFHLGDVSQPNIVGHEATYLNAKAGYATGAPAPSFDDSEWRTLDLPHDWVVEGPFCPSANVSQGYRPRGIAWYRKRFRLDSSDRGRHLEIQFDGVATHCAVWLNGTLVHRNFCGYTSFSIDITSLAQFDEQLNTLVVRVDAEQMEGWWYEGGGIYRHTWLVKRNPVHLKTDGVFAHPIKAPEGHWSIPVEATVANSGSTLASARVESLLLDHQGMEVARGSQDISVHPLDEATARFELRADAPRLWSVEEPTLYRVVTRVVSNGAVLDEASTPCGFRTLRFDADHGFFLNDRHVKLQGVCCHQDHAGVGVAVPDSIWDFRVRRLKEMGVNAYRCAHNPPATEFLEACDRHGLLVMDENRLFNPTPEYLRQLEWLVRRDRNHPSVILWSVFNEEPMQGTEQGYEMVRRMSTVVKRLDPTRPITAAMNGGLFSPLNVSQAVDVVGFNYQIGSYDAFHEANPKLPVTSSEDTSAFQTRGEYHTDDEKHIKDGYDTQFAPWGASHRAGWKAIATRPYLAGGFVWTGFDYRGEPTPFTWPSCGSFFGIMDLCGFAKAAFTFHQAQWIHDRTVVSLIPHWNWPGKEGQPIKVEVHTNAPSAELFLNGDSLGEKPVDPYEMAYWEVPYQPGKLEAVAKRGGSELGRAAVETSGEPVRLRLTPDRSSLSGDGWDAVPVTVEALDAKGRHVPTANLMIDFSLTGPGLIIGLGNGDPNSHEAEKGSQRSLFNGLAQVILQSAYKGKGTMTLRATASGLEPGVLQIEVASVPERPWVPAAEPVIVLDHWRMSPVSVSPLDPNKAVADSDMNSWEQVHPGRVQTFTGGVYALYRTRIQPTGKIQAHGGQLEFHSLTGKAQVWVDGKKLAEKTTASEGALKVHLPPGGPHQVLTVVLQGEEGTKAGLSGSITLR